MSKLDETMKILVVTQSFFPDVDGGSGRFVFELSRRLRQRGHYVTLVGGRTQPDRPASEYLDGMRIHRYGHPLMGSFLPWTFTSPLLVRESASHLFLGDRFDLVWCHHYSPGLGGLLFAEQKGIPGLFTYHASRYLELSTGAGQLRRFNSAASRLLLRWWADSIYLNTALLIEKRCLSMSRRITVLSEFSRRQLEEIHPHEAEKTEVIPGGVDTNRFRPAPDAKIVRVRLGLPEDGFIILTVRRLIRRMGLENLIEAVKILSRSGLNVYLVVGGKGYLQPRLKELAAQSSLGSRVKLLGYIEDEQLPDYYAASDLFVLPTLSLEGFGMVTLEALSCGTPVLGTNVGATPEILKSLDPELILKEPGPECIAQTILKERERYLSPGFRVMCRRHVEARYGWSSIADRMERTMRELLLHEKS